MEWPFMVFGTVSGVLVVALFVWDRAYVRKARAENRNPADNRLTRWMKRHPVLPGFRSPST
jgi:hypothetical protein